ncbi:MAG: NAD-dependent deacylase [Proteobacteria bacterium]|nr:NAD-dependent deacylase [Pseudomonadota bacterium]
MNDIIDTCAAIIASSRSLICLTGAGISVESGIPPFRGPGSLWETIDPMEFAHIQSFMKNPERIWRGFLAGMKDLLDKAMPNDGHQGLVALEQTGRLSTIITQNIDGLHQLAGSSDVIEFHGSFAYQRCLLCDRRIPSKDIDLSRLPPRCDCGGIFRPDCVFFGEMIPPDCLTRSRELAALCDVMLVVGTSAVVQPAAMIPVIAKSNGAIIIEINPEPTPLSAKTSDYVLKGTAGKVLTALVDAVNRIHS